MAVLIIFAGVLASFIFAVTSMKNARFLTRRSACDHCHTRLGWYELIPVLSYIILRGRCLHCKNHIKPGYLVTEILMIFLFILPLFIELSMNNLTLYYLVVILLIPLSIYDYETLTIPNHMTLLFLITGLYLTELYYVEPLKDGMVILILHIVYVLFNDSIGYGDIKLFAVLTLITPFDFFIYTLLVTYIIGGSFIIIINLIRADGIKRVPLVPFITNGIILVFFMYDDMNLIYYGGFL